ncbi:uncharacterized protein SAPINGB_P003192 [Magnusiomyces paraingens]|uniref:precorrin-2 dehydrogenase n=1 Tax=Magnusiomyces paraingens TaxID=2606893 RepID=A0A5E8BQD7_9ASCO|nr:uncharacterized protein SAPINGB_P003192 [Saprochaete ingens]VVT51725.1 unnamed protein product [Saprochaete ingens]
MNVLPGGSLIIAWQVKSRPVLVVGGGDVACGRVSSLLSADAVVTVVAPALPNDDLRAYIESHPTITYINITVTQDSIKDLLSGPDGPLYSMVLTAIDAPDISRAIHAECKRVGIPVNIADVPPLCDFYFASTIRRGPLQVAVSTGGSAPRLARRIRLDIERGVDSLGDIEKAIENTAVLRAKLRVLTDNKPELHKTDQEKIRSRMQWMSRVCDSLSYTQLAQLKESLMDTMVSAYPNDPIM